MFYHRNCTPQTKEIKVTSIKKKMTKVLAFSLRVAGAGCKQALLTSEHEYSIPMDF